MKKRIILLATALLCAFAICLSSIPALAVFAEEETSAELTNVALGKTVTITEDASLEVSADAGGDSYGVAMLTDGLFGWYANQTNLHSSGTKQRGWNKASGFVPSEENPIDIVIDLDGSYDVSSIAIRPAVNYNACFPTYFEIQVSATADGDDWVTVHEAEGVTCNGRLSSSASLETYETMDEANKIYVAGLTEVETARRVRLHITTPSALDAGNGDCYMGFSEVEVYGVAAATEIEPAPELTNVALNASVDINDVNTIEDGANWGTAFLVDGNTTTAWHGDYINSDGTDPANPTKLTIALGDQYEISSISVYAYTGNVYASTFWDPPILVPVLPQAYTLEVFSVEEGAWVEVGDYTIAAEWNMEVADPTVLTYDFDPVVATKVRVTINENGGYWDPAYFRSGVTLIGDVAVMGRAAEGVTEIQLVDVALNQYAEGSSHSIEDGNWGAQTLFLGNKSTAAGKGWHHIEATPGEPNTISATNAPQITVWLGSVCTIHQIDLYPVNAYNDAYISVMPQDFIIELSADGGLTWETVATRTGVQSQVAGIPGHWYSDGKPEVNVPYTIELDQPTDANMFRMTITKGGSGANHPDHGNTYAPFTAIGSIEMLGVPGEPPLETETQAPAVTETQAPVETETQAPVVTETEAPEVTETEAVVESDVESDVESAEDTAEEITVEETAADTVVDETVADTTAATEAPAADEGCASVVGFGAVAVLAAAAAAFVLKKKD